MDYQRPPTAAELEAEEAMILAALESPHYFYALGTGPDPYAAPAAPPPLVPAPPHLQMPTGPLPAAAASLPPVLRRSAVDAPT